jgi:hypothetical protein
VKSQSMKRLLGAALAVSLVSFGQITTALLPSSANSVAELSNVGEKAFQDLTTCLTSGKSRKVDVLYLIDTSGSLDWTDPEKVRREILSTSMSQLGSFAEQGIEVSAASALFSSSVEIVQDWQSIASQADADQAALALSDRISNQKPIGNTNWEGAISYAEREFASLGDSCKVLIWFTDGGINRDDSTSGRVSDLARLCHSGISEGRLDNIAGDQYGVMSNLKASGVTVFGVLFNNEENTYSHRLAQGDSPQEAQNYLDSERYWMSYMRPLVEGFGSVESDVKFSDVPAGGELQCNELSEGNTAPAGFSNGAYLNAVDPIGLAFQFLKIQAQISGGSQSAIVDGEFEIKAGTVLFQVLTTSDDWTITGPEGSEFSINNGGASSPGVGISSSASATTIEVEIEEGDESLLGLWTIDTDSGSSAELYVFTGLTLFLDRDKDSKIIADRANTLSGKIVREQRFEDRSIDLSQFEQSEITLSVLENGKFVDVATVKPELDGQFKIENFTPAFTGGDSIELLLTLDLGGDFQPIASKFNLSLMDKAAFAFAAQDLIQLSALTGPEGVATGAFEVNGPSSSDSSEYCVAGAPERTEDIQTGVEKSDRDATFIWTFKDTRPQGAEASFVAGADQQPFCFSVGKDEIVSVGVEVRNEQQADGNVISIRPVTSKAAAADASFDESLRFEFESNTEQNDFVVALVIALLLLIGLLGPLALLYLWNLMSTKFIWTPGTVRAEYPITLTPGAAALSIQDARTASAGGRLTVGPQDFVFTTDREDPRVIEDEPQGLMRARVPLFPLASSWFEWNPTSGNRILSLSSEAAKNTKEMASGMATEVSPRVTEIWAIVVPETELTKEDSAPLRATLVAYSAMGALGDYQKKITEISNKPGLQERLSSVRFGYSEELAKAASSKGSLVSDQDLAAPTPTGTPTPIGIKIPGVDATPPPGIPIPGITSPGAPFKPGGEGSGPSINVPGIPKS